MIPLFVVAQPVVVARRPDDRDAPVRMLLRASTNGATQALGETPAAGAGATAAGPGAGWAGAAAAEALAGAASSAAAAAAPIPRRRIGMRMTVTVPPAWTRRHRPPG